MSKSIFANIRIALAFMILLIMVAFVITTQWFWKVVYPLPYEDIIMEVAAEAEMDPYFIAAVIRTESNFMPQAVSTSGAVGLMQLMPKTAEWMANEIEVVIPDDQEALYDPNLNIQLGTFYLKHLLNKYENNTALALAAYNSGMGRVKEWISQGVWDGSYHTAEDIPFEETRFFVKKVLRAYEIYLGLYGG